MAFLIILTGKLNVYRYVRLILPVDRSISISVTHVMSVEFQTSQSEHKFERNFSFCLPGIQVVLLFERCFGVWNPNEGYYLEWKDKVL